MSKDIPLLSSFLPNPDLTKFGKIFGEDKYTDLTKISKAPKPTKPNGRQNNVVGKFVREASNTKDLMGLNPKFYILNSINNQKENSSSGGVEATITKKSRIVRLSISPSQGDDPGFESRPEHPYM